MNVIGWRPTGWWRDRPGAMRELAGRLAVWARDSGEQVTLVLDGRPVELGAHPGVEVVFASERGRAHSAEGRGSDGRNAADRVLAAMAEQASDRGDLVVVTSDRELAERLGELGVAVEGAGGFAARLPG